MFKHYNESVLGGSDPVAIETAKYWILNGGSIRNILQMIAPGAAALALIDFKYNGGNGTLATAKGLFYAGKGAFKLGLGALKYSALGAAGLASHLYDYLEDTLGDDTKTKKQKARAKKLKSIIVKAYNHKKSELLHNKTKKRINPKSSDPRKLGGSVQLGSEGINGGIKKVHLQKRILNEDQINFLVYMCNKNPYIKEDRRFIEACIKNPKKMNTLMESTGMINERALELMRLASKLEEAGLGGLIKSYFTKNPDIQNRYQGEDNANYRAAMNANNMVQLQHYLPMLTKQERRAVIGNFMKKQALAGKAAVGRGLDSAGAAVKSKIKAGADAVDTFTDRLGELPGRAYRKAGVALNRIGNAMSKGEKLPYHPIEKLKSVGRKVGNALSGIDAVNWTPKGPIPVQTVDGTILSFNKFKKNFAEAIDAYSHVISPRNLYNLYVLECAANIYGLNKKNLKEDGLRQSLGNAISLYPGNPMTQSVAAAVELGKRAARKGRQAVGKFATDTFKDVSNRSLRKLKYGTTSAEDLIAISMDRYGPEETKRLYPQYAGMVDGILRAQKIRDKKRSETNKRLGIKS